MNEDGRNSADDSFAAVAEHAPAMLWRGDAAGKCIYLNRALRIFWGVPDNGVESFTWSTTLLAEDSDKVFAPFSRGMERQEAFACEARYRRYDGVIRILATRAEPSFNSAGVFTGMVGVNLDVTDERAAQAELAESEARLRSLADNLPFGMIYQIVRDDEGVRRFSYVSSRCKELNGVDPEAAMANPALLHSQIIEEDRDAFTAAEACAFAAMKPFEAEARIRKPSGEVRWFKVASAPRTLADGSVVWDGVQVDIHDAKMAEERQGLLMTEMGHRIKNNLSTVLSIAAQTGRSAKTYEAFHASFQARLMALAKSHDLLLRDTSDSADLRDILESELRPYSAEAGARSLMLEGEPMRLPARAAVAVTLVVHELATNAAKYGAYAAGGGEIHVAWRLREDGMAALTWRERGGPTVTTPNKPGFGSRLIESIVRGELEGALAPRFGPQGFEADLTFRPAGKLP